MTAQIIQIGNRFYRIYGEGNAEYLLLQMTDEHELQSMGSEVAAIAQDTSQFLFAAVPVMNWNDELSPWKSPPCGESKASAAILWAHYAF
ncbi:MAG: hypothetical protein ACLSB9_36095 [Hydrogeniiclostridium mannosilyticum]